MSTNPYDPEIMAARKAATESLADQYEAAFAVIESAETEIDHATSTMRRAEGAYQRVIDKYPLTHVRPEAFMFDCPKCGATPGNSCVNTPDYGAVHFDRQRREKIAIGIYEADMLTAAQSAYKNAIAIGREELVKLRAESVKRERSALSRLAGRR